MQAQVSSSNITWHFMCLFFGKIRRYYIYSRCGYV